MKAIKSVETKDGYVVVTFVDGSEQVLLGVHENDISSIIGDLDALKEAVKKLQNDVTNAENSALDAYITDTASGAIANFPDGADDVPVKDLMVKIEPVQSGSGDPSPDNVRPITGWTGATVQRCGKNLFNIDSALENKWISTSSMRVETILGATVFTVDVPKNTTVTYTADAGDRCVIVGYKKRPDNILDTTYDEIYSNRSTQWLSLTFNTNECEFLAFYLSRYEESKPTKIQLELGSTATAYEVYQGEAYDITFPPEAGTVYGGTLDVTTGVLTVDRANIASYNGETLPSTWISDRDVYAEGTTPITGVQVVYELATPITYQLTPTEVRTLLGTNNIWADTGDTTVEYRVDPNSIASKLDNLTTEIISLDTRVSNLESNTLHIITEAISFTGVEVSANGTATLLTDYDVSALLPANAILVGAVPVSYSSSVNIERCTVGDTTATINKITVACKNLTGSATTVSSVRLMFIYRGV